MHLFMSNFSILSQVVQPQSLFSRGLRDSTTCFDGSSVRRSIGPSVSPSVRHTLLFLGFCGFWPHCSCPNDGVTSIMAPAHPHATGVAVYPALFLLFLVACTRLYTPLCLSVGLNDMCLLLTKPSRFGNDFHLTAMQKAFFFCFAFFFFAFLVACTRLYTPLCWSVRPSVRPSIRPSVHLTLLFLVFFFAVFGLTAPAQMMKRLKIWPLPTRTRLRQPCIRPYFIHDLLFSLP